MAEPCCLDQSSSDNPERRHALRLNQRNPVLRMRKSGARGCGRVRAVPMVFRRRVMAHAPPVNEHLFAWTAGLFAAMVAVIAGAIATRVRLLPEVIDVSIIPTGAGLGSLGFAFYGALRRYEPDRIGRLTLLGTLLGAAGTVLGLVLALTLDVLS